MIYFKLFLSILFLSSLVTAKESIYKIALIDSGVNVNKNIKICKTGSYDFIELKKGVGIDNWRHGTLMAEIITAKNKNINHCIMVYKVVGAQSNAPIYAAILMAIKNGARAINISLIGKTPDVEEYNALKQASNANIGIFTAAGNNGIDLSYSCMYFPACYTDIKNLFMVGALKKKKIAVYSNYGKQIKIWRDGSYKDIQGTSVSTAKATADFIYYLGHNEP